VYCVHCNSEGSECTVCTAIARAVSVLYALYALYVPTPLLTSEAFQVTTFFGVLNDGSNTRSFEPFDDGWIANLSGQDLTLHTG
jgi:hypothetical protein